MSDTNPFQPLGDPPRESGAGRPRRQAAIAFILLTIFIDILGIGIVIPVLPLLVEQLLTGNVESTPEGASLASGYYGAIAAVYALMQFVFAPIVGALSDRYGRRPVILGSLFGLGLDFLIQGFANNIVWLFAGRMLAGVMGASFSTANAYIADVSDDDTRTRNFGFVGMMFGLGFTVGPALGGVLGSYDIRLPFFVAAGLAFVNWLYGFFVLPESLPREKRSSFTIANANPFNSIKHLQAYPFVAGIAIVFVCKALAQRGLENVWVLSTLYRFEWDEFTNGKALCLVGVMAIIVQGGLVRPIIKRIGERKAILYSTVISAIAFLAYGLATQGWMMYWIIVFGSLGGLAGPAIQSLVTSTVDETEQGKIQGALTSLTSVTNVIAPLFFTSFLFNYFTSDAAPVKIPGAPFLVGAVLLVIALFIAIRVFKRFPESEVASKETSIADDKTVDHENAGD